MSSSNSSFFQVEKTHLPHISQTNDSTDSKVLNNLFANKIKKPKNYNECQDQLVADYIIHSKAPVLTLLEQALQKEETSFFLARLAQSKSRHHQKVKSFFAANKIIFDKTPNTFSNQGKEKITNVQR